MQQFANDETVRRGWNLQPGQMLGANHERVSVESTREIARARLNEIITTGAAKAGNVVQRILNEVPEDRIATAHALSAIVEDTGTVKLGVKDDQFGLHRNAYGQLLGRVGVPMQYADSLGVSGAEGTWRRELLRTTLREHLANTDQRFLLRSVNGQVRGVLSDHYRRLDSRPLLEAFVQGCKEIGAQPVDGVGGELRMSVRAIVPQVYEPTPGECMVFGLSQTNSDFGCGTYSISFFALRLVCLNGLVTESSLKQVHLGGKLPDSIVFSAETYRKDTEAMVSATRDIVRGILAPAAIESRIAQIAKASETEISTEGAMRRVAKVLNKGEQQAVKDAFDGGDVMMLPPGKTAWRFSNALSWVANSVEDPERRIELQQLAGTVATAA